MRTLCVQRLTPTATLPTRAHSGDAGLDLYADEDLTIPPHNATATVSTGIAVAISPGWCGQVWPRSGMAANKEVSPDAGLIDSGYRGELRVVLVNRGAFAYPVHRGDRIAQLVLTVASDAAVLEVFNLFDTERGTTGFGDSGQ